MTQEDKRARLLELARRRQASRWDGYHCIGDYHGGAYECDHVSPYTKTANNADSPVMVLLQDWGSDDALSGPLRETSVTLGHTPWRQTNRRLRALLRRHLGLELEQTYGTNVFPFIKPGRMKSSIRRLDMERAGREFALPQIEIVEPRLAICFGRAAFNAVRVAAGLPRARRLADALASPFEVGTTRVWCQAHPGQLGTNQRNRLGADQVDKDWEAMRSNCGFPAPPP